MTNTQSRDGYDYTGVESGVFYLVRLLPGGVIRQRATFPCNWVDVRVALDKIFILEASSLRIKRHRGYSLYQ